MNDSVLSTQVLCSHMYVTDLVYERYVDQVQMILCVDSNLMNVACLKWLHVYW